MRVLVSKSRPRVIPVRLPLLKPMLPGWGRVDTPQRVTWPALGDHLEKGSSPSGPTLADLKKQEGSSPGAEEAPVTTGGPQP